MQQQINIFTAREKQYKDMIETLHKEIALLRDQLQKQQIPITVHYHFSVHNYEHNSTAIYYWSGCNNYSDLVSTFNKYTHDTSIPIMWHHLVTQGNYGGDQRGPKPKRDNIDKFFMFLVKCKHDIPYEGLLNLLNIFQHFYCRVELFVLLFSIMDMSNSRELCHFFWENW